MITTLLVSACAVHKELVPTGGSRSDGTVKMSFEVGPFEQPQIDGQQGIYSATQRCKAWGYSGAEPFGGATTICQNGNCTRRMVTFEYQCTGKPEATK
jgi:hypothetical protein